MLLSAQLVYYAPARFTAAVSGPVKISRRVQGHTGVGVAPVGNRESVQHGLVAGRIYLEYYAAAPEIVPWAKRSEATVLGGPVEIAGGIADQAAKGMPPWAPPVKV